MNGLFALSASKIVSAVLAAFVRCLRCFRVSFFLGFSLLLLKQPKRRPKMDMPYYVIYTRVQYVLSGYVVKLYGSESRTETTVAQLLMSIRHKSIV